MCGSQRQADTPALHPLRDNSGVRRLFKRWSDQIGLTGQVRPASQVRLAQYNTYDARALFSQLLRRVRDGEQIVIAHAGVPVALLSPFRPHARRPGVIRAHLVMHAADPNMRRGAEPTPTRSSQAASS
ncbi:MAG: type II toxin-antitoxin system prevent-host-death family antitoxin [Actinobacteria bacterium]|nr:MAG: type II toxin-antitoxin system prevent-host-death family antitoxin [Actinomycetota bacterium]